MAMTPDTSKHGSDAGPDFAALYEADYELGAHMTPRMACWLWQTCLYLADTWRDNRDDPEPLLEFLPPIARPFAHGEWLDRFTDGFDALATRIAEGAGDQERLAACTGDEMALHLAVDLAEAHLRDGIIGPQDAPASSLPDQGDADSDFDTMRDLLFTDHDVLILFDPLMDGAEIPGGELARVARYANLHPRDWFEPFALS
ncbi:MAG: hypothetical protein LC808_27780 [Actinobacteria bacterium]|nr:hypothetical protein [Actinomycetota bacterium]